MDLIAAACKCLDDGQIEEAASLLRNHSSEQSTVRDNVAVVAAGLTAERHGRISEADGLFEAALASGIPFPPVLRECARYFRRTNQYRKSFECYALLESVYPNLIMEFIGGLPPAELCRYATRIVPSLLAGARPAFYPLQPVKESMVAQLGVKDAALAFAYIAGRAAPEVSWMRLTGLRDFARSNAMCYEEILAPRQVELDPPPVFERTMPPGARIVSRAFFFCELADAVVPSKSNFLLCGDHALLDFQNEEMMKYPLNLDVDPLIFAVAADGSTVAAASPPAANIVMERALSLVGVHSAEFGHWMIEFLPKLWACLDRPDFASLPLLVDEQMPRQHREALQFFAGADHPIVVLKAGDTALVRRLSACSMIIYFPVGAKPGLDDDASELAVLDNDGLASLIRRAYPKLNSIEQSNGPRRLYLTRKDSQARRLVNRQAVEKWATEQGFSVVDMAAYSFLDQLRLIRGADIIMGPEGSAFFLANFARPGTRIGTLSNPFLEDAEYCSRIWRALGHRHCVLVGEVAWENPSYKKFSDFSIDVEKLPEFLKALLSLP